MKQNLLALALTGMLGLGLARAIGDEVTITPQENKIIQYTAKRVGVEDELLKAIRKSENGGKGIEFGIMHTPAYEKDNQVSGRGAYENEFEKQASWCAWTIRKNKQRFEKLPVSEKSKYTDFIDYLGDTYCPVGAKNDPRGLNKNWEKNVRTFYERFRGK